MNPEQISIWAAKQTFAQLLTEDLVRINLKITGFGIKKDDPSFHKIAHLLSPDGKRFCHSLVETAFYQTLNERI